MTPRLNRSADGPDRPKKAIARVLLIEDSPDVAAAVSELLFQRSYEVRSTATGREGLMLLETFDPHVIILDLGLEDMDGIEVCRAIRQTSDVYLLMLTARVEEVDRVLGLSAGADDYVTKPFSPRELIARVEALLRRPRQTTPKTHRVGDLTLDLHSREVLIGDASVELTKTEFDILETLVSHPQRVFSRQQLIDRVWGDWFGDTHTIDVHVSNLRRKLAAAGKGVPLIRTVRGVGYGFVLPAEDSNESSTAGHASASQPGDARASFEHESDQIEGRPGVPSDFRGDVLERLLVIERALRATLDDSLDDDLRREALRAAHSLKGSLGMLNFHQGVEVASKAEEAFQPEAGAVYPGREELVDDVAALLHQLA